MNRFLNLTGSILITLSVPAEAQPNIILVLADDLGYEDLGIQGSEEVSTPHLDSLAKDGIRFTDAYATAPVCSPSRAGLLTGRYQNRFGFEFLVSEEAIAAPGQLIGLPPGETTIADRLKSLGYHTACIGKWHLGKETPFLPTARGFDEFYGTLGQSGYFEPMLVDSRIDLEPRKMRKSGYYTTDDYNRRAVEFIQNHADDPFFLFLSHFTVHKPHEATRKYLGRFPDIKDPVRRSYAAMLSAMDDGVGMLLKALREKGIEENTLIVFLSDNGGTQGSSNRPLRGKKGGTWEGGIRTPMLMQWKSRFPGGVTCTKPVIALDLLPTLVAAAGGEIAESWNLDGSNLLPFLEGESEGGAQRVFFWRFGTQWAVREGHWKLVQAREEKGGSIQIAKVGPIRLFDLAQDPGEEFDLAASKPRKAAALRELWQEWADELPEPSWFPPALD